MAEQLGKSSVYLHSRLHRNQSSASKFYDSERHRDRLAERRPSVKQTVGGNVALLRPTRQVNKVVLEVDRRCNCKYLLICKEDGIDGTFWKFTQQLVCETQTGDTLGISHLLCYWYFLTYFRRNLSRIIRTTDKQWMSISLAICHVVQCV